MMSPLQMKLITFCLYWLTRVLCWTYRFRFLNEDEFQQQKQLVWSNPQVNPNYLFCLWHQNLMAGLLSQSKTPHCILVSPSKDGELLVQVCLKMRYKIARGSSSRQGVKGMVEMIKNLRQGIPGAITVDGPKGPAHEVKLGALEIARKTQTPIFAYSALPEKYWSLNSWDKFRIPKPFSKIAISISPPLLCNDDHQPLEALALQLKTSLHLGEKQCEAYFKNVNGKTSQVNS